LEGTFDATGKTAEPDALTGFLAPSSCKTVMLQQFARAPPALGANCWQIEELMQLDLEQAEAKYRLAGNTPFLDRCGPAAGESRMLRRCNQRDKERWPPVFAPVSP